MTKKNSKILFLSFIFSYYFISTIFLNINFIWFDDWFIIKDYIDASNKLKEFFFKFENGHLILIYRIFIFSNIEYLNLNLNIFKYINLIFLIFSFVILNLLLEKYKIDFNNKFYIFLIFLNPEIICSWYQGINTVWFISSFFILLFLYLEIKSYLLFFFFSILMIFSNNFTLSAIGYFLFIKFLKSSLLNKMSKKLFLIFVLIIVAIYLIYSGHNFFLNFILSFFASLSNVYLPWIGKFYPVAFIIGLIQFSVILYFEIKKKKIEILEKLINFSISNPFIIISLIFSFMYAVSRNDVFNVMASRYVFASIFFQIGFILYLIKEKIFFLKYLKLFIIFAFLQGLLSPYSGLHWQLIKISQINSLNSCFKESKLKNTRYDCIKKMRKITLSNNINFSLRDLKDFDEILIKKNLISY